jgi:hypothetical protein
MQDNIIRLWRKDVELSSPLQLVAKTPSDTMHPQFQIGDRVITYAEDVDPRNWSYGTVVGIELQVSAHFEEADWAFVIHNDSPNCSTFKVSGSEINQIHSIADLPELKQKAIATLAK